MGGLTQDNLDPAVAGLLEGAAFMAARCESNAYYSRPDLQQARSYDNFKKLQEQYSRTQFYNRIIEECLYFKAYARQ